VIVLDHYSLVVGEYSCTGHDRVRWCMVIAAEREETGEL
jgi:hypothetical protein